MGFMWRPRPKSLLTREEGASILKDWKSWKQTFDQKDIKAREFASDEERQERVRLLQEFEVQVARWKAVHARQAEIRHELRGYTTDDEEDSVDVQEKTETLID